MLASIIIEPSDLSILNDRMQYQQGAFLLLENDSLNQQSKYNQTSMTIIKYVLSVQLLEKLSLRLRKEYPNFTIDYLLDPYKFLEKL